MHKLAFKKPVKSGVIGCETEKITQFRGGVPDDCLDRNTSSVLYQMAMHAASELADLYSATQLMPRPILYKCYIGAVRPQPGSSWESVSSDAS